MTKKSTNQLLLKNSQNYYNKNYYFKIIKHKSKIEKHIILYKNIIFSKYE